MFDSINKSFSGELVTFSPKRLFTVVKGENKLDVLFSVPQKPEDRATVDGYGVVLADIDKEGVTKVTFYDANDCIIATEYAPANNQGLSFVGGYFPDTPIYRVRIVLGDVAIDRPNECDYYCRIGWRSGKTDRVVMDDFIYSEPQKYY